MEHTEFGSSSFTPQVLIVAITDLDRCMLPWSVKIDLLSTYAHYIFFWACGSCIAACGALRFVKLCTPFHQVCA
jgi:hypothetical protein